MKNQALIDQFVSEARAMSLGGVLSFTAVRGLIAQALQAEAKAGGKDRWFYVEDVFPGFFVYHDEPNTGYVKRSYAIVDGKVTLGEQKTPVVQTWIEVQKEAWQAAQEVLNPTPTDAARLTETETGPLSEAALEEGESGAGPVLKGVVLIQEGRSRNGREYTRAVLERDGPTVFEGVPAYVTNHNPADKHLNNLVGAYRNVRMDGGKLKADLHGLPSAAAQLQRAVEAQRAFGAGIVGLSIDTAGKFAVQAAGRTRSQVVERLYRTPQTSVDIVINPAAGGRLTEALQEECDVHKLAKLTEAVLKQTPAALVAIMIEGMTPEQIREANPALAEAIMAKAKETDPPTPPAQERTEDNPPATQLTEADLDQRIEQRVTERMRLVECQNLLATKVAEAKLGETERELVLAKFGSRIFETKDLDAEIARLKDRAGRQNPNRPRVGGGDGLQVTQESWDLHKLALEGMFRGEDVKDKKGEVVPRYRSIKRAVKEMAGLPVGDVEECREAWESGIFVWRGIPGRESWMREAVTDTTFNVAFADVMFKVLLDQTRQPAWNTWRLWCEVVPFSDLTHNRKFIRMGGYGNIDPVAQGGTYQYITTPDDEQSSFKPSKYGNLERWTWEAFLADDLLTLRRIPINLGIAWARTIHDGVYGMLQSNSGVGDTMDYDTTALYNARASGSNIQTAALSRSTYLTARTQMRKMTELSSSKRLDIRPRYCLYATPDLDETAFELFLQNVRNTTNLDSTLESLVYQDRILPVGVVYPTATTQRAELVADKNDVVGALVGFLGGREEPELFIQDAELVGSRFTADQTTIKIRGTFGSKLIDHRAFQRIQNT